MALPPQAQIVIRTELAGAAYAGMTSQQKADALNAYQVTVEAKTVPNPPATLKELLGAITQPERKVILRHPVLPLFIQSYQGRDLAAAKRWVESCVDAGEIVQISGDSVNALIDRTAPITVTTKRLPRFFELIRGIPSCPNVIEPSDIDAL